jgi:hypothetical protein
MSRQIDLSNVTQEDLDYIQARPWLVTEAADLGLAIKPTDSLNDVKVAIAGLVELDSGSLSPEESDPTGDTPELRYTAVGGSTGREEPTELSEPVEYVPYRQGTASQLRAELKARGLNQVGTKKELVARLEEDDKLDLASDD